jgi:hypothetical protein
MSFLFAQKYLRIWNTPWMRIQTRDTSTLQLQKNCARAAICAVFCGVNRFFQPLR